MLSQRNYVAFLLLWLATLPQVAADQGLEVMLDGKRQTLLPAAFNAHRVVAFTPNGSMLDVAQTDLQDPKVVPRFEPYSQQQMRDALLREFGRHFEVSGTGNYLVVHPKGARDLWADRFEQLYRSMVHFFRVRGFPMAKPRYPLVSVVFYSQRQYLEYGRRILKTGLGGSCGVYIPKTNRIYLYDDTRGVGTASPRWEENLATIMHEAAHQTAFNCSIHTRGSETPAWIVEGLGCLFEGKGIYNAPRYRREEHRINYGRFSAFQSIRGDAEAMISSVVASDTLFRRDPGRAYATAWAMTYYLSEREPRKYVRYLKAMGQRKPLATYSASQRIRDFNTHFGSDYQMLAVRLVRYMEELPPPPRPQRE